MSTILQSLPVGQKVGIAHVSVQRGSEGLLTQALRERGWTVAEG